jgi:hypothetical protein
LKACIPADFEGGRGERTQLGSDGEDAIKFALVKRFGNFGRNPSIDPMDY